MRIEELSSEIKQNRTRIAAKVIWEDCERPTREIYFEVDETFAEDLACNPHAFLVGCILPAMRHGEERIAIDETICPELQNGLRAAMGWICHWYGPPRKPVHIETKEGTRYPLPRTAQRHASFLSGGVDSLTTVRANRLNFPIDHPMSIKDCLVVHGFDIGALERAGQELDFFERALAALTPIAEDAGVTLIPIFTNVRYLDDDVHFWMFEFVGAGLASVAHVLAPRLTTASIASTIDIPNMSPEGTHPLLDPNYSSADLQIRHDGVRLSRLEKVRLVADWDVALQNLRVCTWNPSDGLNCGKCEKCIRTMVELLVVGKLADARSFPEKDVSSELLGSMRISTKYEDAWYHKLIDPLTVMGRLDLVEVIKEKSAQFHKDLAWIEERDWKGTIKRFDRRYLGSSLFRSYKAARDRVIRA